MDLFKIGLEVDTRDLKKGTTELGKFAKAGKGVETQTKKTSSAVQSATRAIGAYISAATALRALRTADTYQLLNDRIRLATEATGDFAKVQKDLFLISQETGTGLQNNVELFDRIRIGAEELGRSNSEVLKLVTAIDQLGASGGTSQTALSAATTQFSQALAGGILRAEEFNSIVENTPKIAQAIAKGLDTSIGGLRQMVLDGTVLADDVFESLLSQSDEIADNFEKMPVRLGRATTTFSNSITKLIGELDEVSGLSTGLAGSIDSIADAIDKVTENQDELQDTIEIIGNVSGALAGASAAYLTYAAATRVATGATLLFNKAAKVNPLAAIALSASALVGYMLTLQDETEEAAEAVDRLTKSSGDLDEQQKSLLKTELNRFLLIKKARAEELASQVKQIEALRSSESDIFKAGRAGEDETLDALRENSAEVLGEIRQIEDKLYELSRIKINVTHGGESEDEIIALQKEQDALNNLMYQYELYQDIRNEPFDIAEKFDWTAAFESATPSFVDALASGDFSQLGNSIGDIVGGAVSTKLGAGIGSSIAGGLAGAAVGYVISNLTSKYESTGSTSNLSVSGSSLSGFNEESFKKSGLFGSSRKTEVDNYTSSEISAISNTVTSAQSSIVNLLSNMGSSIAVGVEDFKTNVSASDPAAAVEEITNEFISANVAYIEDFQELNQTALSALSDLSETVSSVTDSFSISTGSSLEDAFSSYISNQAANLSNYYSTTLPNQLRNQQASLQGEINNILNSASSYRTTGRDDQNTRLKSQLKARIKDLEADIASVEGQIVESLSRVGSSLANATATFTTGVEKSLASIYNINTDDVPQLLSELVSNYEQGFFTASEQAARAVSNAESALSDFSSLGINATTSLDEFQAKFEAFTKSSGFNPTTYAQWLAASDAMLTLNSAVEANADLVEESASALEDVNKRILAAQDNDEALLAIERAEELAAAESDLVKARLNELYAIEDAISSTEVFDTITNFVEELMGLSADGTQSLASARTAYIEALNLAATGDEDAISEVSGLAQTFLDLFADQASTSSEVANNRATVISQLQAATTGTTIPAFANGGQHSGGWAMVGEQGPELVNMGPSAVYSNSDSKKMLDNSDTIGAINNMANYLGGALRVIAKNSKTMSDYIELWDNEGLPINSETPINVEVV